MNDKIESLYNNLLSSRKTDESEIGTMDQFRSAIKDERTARQFYRNLKGAGKLTEAEIGTEDQFYNSISSDFKVGAVNSGLNPVIKDTVGPVSDTPAFGTKISDSVLSPEFKRGNKKTDDEVQYNAGTPTIDEQRKKLSDFEAENKDFLNEWDRMSKKRLGKLDYTVDDFFKKNTDRYKDIKKRRDELLKAIDTHPDEEAWRKEFSSAAEERLKFSEEKERGLREEYKKLPFTNKIWRDDNTMEIGREVDNFITARALYKRAGGMIDAPSKHGGGSGFSNFLKGAGNAATDGDVWSMGITSIVRDYNVGGVLKKLGENKEGKDLDIILTPGEQEVLRAITALKTAESSRSHDLSLGYSAGQGAVNSVPYMAEFLLTGGIATAASKAATGAVLRWLVKNTLSKGLAREALKGVVWGTKAGIETLVRTPLMPSTYKNIADARIGTDDNGLLELKNWGEAIKQGGVGSFIDNLGEASGAHIAGALGLAGKAAGKVIPKAVTELAGKLSTSRAKDIWNVFKNSNVTDFMKRAGYNGILEEAGEEWYSAALRSATIEPDALKNYATVDNQLVTVASFLPMALGGAGVSVAMNMRNAARYKKSADNLDNLLRSSGMDDAQVTALKAELADADTRHVSEILTPIVNKVAGSDPELGKQVYGVVCDYMCSRNISGLSEGALRDRTKEDEDGNKVFVLDETDKGSLVESEDCSKKFVVSSRLKDVEDVGKIAAEPVMRDTQIRPHVPGDIAMFNGQPVTIQRVELDGSVIVENRDGTVEQVEAKDLKSDNPGTSVDFTPEQEMPSDADVPQPENIQQDTPLAEKTVPLTKAGKPDYNAMLAADPDLFASEWEKRSSPEKARAALEKQSGSIGTRIKSLQKKLDTETDFNRIADLEDEISTLEQQKTAVDGVVSARYASPAQESGAVRDVPLQNMAETAEISSARPVFSGEEEAVRWVAEESEDVGEILGTYETVREQQKSVLKNTPRWQQELIGRKVTPESFYRFSDRNKASFPLRKGWLRKDGVTIDQLSRDLSDYGVEVSEQDIVNFILENPSGTLRQSRAELDKLGQRFSDVASRIAGTKIGRPESPTGKLFIEKMKTTENAEQLQKQLQDARRAEEESLKSIAEQAEAERQDVGDMLSAGENFNLERSDRLDDAGNVFYRNSEGSIDLWNLPDGVFEKIGRQKAPIRLTDYNVEHIMSEHEKEFAGSEQDVFDFINGVFSGFNEVRKKGRTLFVVVSSSQTGRATLIKLYPGRYGEYYNVESAGFYREKSLKQKDLIWTESEPHVADSGSAGTSTSHPLQAGRGAFDTVHQTKSVENKDTHIQTEKQEPAPPTEEEQTEIEQAVAEMREERGEYRDGGEVYEQDDEGAIRFRESEGTEPINQKFNDELSRQIEGKLQVGHVYQLGRPSEALLSAGIPDLPIEIPASRLLLKSSNDYKSDHPFELSEVMNLPEAVQNPVAVFESETDPKRNVVLTELKNGNDNFLAVLDVARDGKRNEINSVISLYPKNSSVRVGKWFDSRNQGDIGRDLLKWVDKEKAFRWLSGHSSNVNATGLSSKRIANIVQNFENPTLGEGKIHSAIDELSDRLGVKVTKAKNRTDLPEGIQRQMKGGRYPGLYDPKTGRVYVVMDEITDVPDAQATVLHEILGHKGIRELFGARLPEFCRRVLETIPEQQRSALFGKYAEGKSREDLSPGQQETLRQLAAEEYVASFAEGYTDPSAWEKIKAIIRDMLRSVGIDLKLSDNDLKYILWKARNGLRESDGLMETAQKIAKDKKVGDILFRKNPDKNLSSEEFITKKRTTAELYRQQIVDSAVSVKRLTDYLRTRGTKIRDFEDAYSESLLADSKSHQAVKRYQEEYQHPLNEAIVALMKKSNKSFPDVCHYVIAKHAPERNGMIESRNGMKDGSGLSDVEAGEIVRKFEDGCDQKDISELWKRINSSTRFALERQRDDGFMSGKMFDQINGMFSYYVPLKGWEETDGVDYTKSERYSPFSGSGKKARAEGRTSMADNPFAHIEMAAENAIRQGDQNYVRQCLYNMCVNNPDADLYSVSKTYYVEKDGEWIAQHERPDDSLFRSGKARTELAGAPHKDLIKTADAKRYDVDVWVGGEKRTITFAQGEQGLDIADAINRARVVRPGRVSEVFGRATRFIASVNTSKNPEFVVRNFERDFLYAVPAYAIKGGNSFRLMANLPKAFRALNDEFMNGAGKENNQRNRYVEEYLGSGGKTGFVHSLSIESRRRKLTKEINRMRNSGTASGRAMAVGKAIGNTMEYLGDMSENSIRLAVFMTERENGKGISEAAMAAKEITVNFNRKGNLSPVLGSYYAFFNASVQGSLYNFVGLGVKWTNRTIFASAVLGVIQLMAAWMSRWFGDDDELGVSGYDRLSDYTRNNNIILPDIMRVGKLFGWQNEEGQKYGFMTIPMPQSFRAVSAAGIIADQVYRGHKSVARGMMEIADNLVANLSPLDLEFYNFSEGKPWMFAARSLPTVAQPFVDIIANKDFADRQIYRDEFLKSLEGKVPESSLGMKNTNGLFVSLAKAANRTANGTDNINPELRVAGDGGVTRNGFMGWLDWNPAVMEHVVEGITGGGGRFWNNVYKTAEAAFTEKEADNSDIPFLRTHRTMPYRKTHWEMYFDLRDQVADVDFVAGVNKKAGNYGTHIRVLTKSNQINNKVSFSYIDQVVKGMRDLSGMATTPEAKEIFLQQMDKAVLEWAKARKKAEKENPGKD